MLTPDLWCVPEHGSGWWDQLSAGQEGAIDEKGGVLRDFLQGWNAAGESIREDCCHSVDGPADGRW